MRSALSRLSASLPHLSSSEEVLSEEVWLQLCQQREVEKEEVKVKMLPVEASCEGVARTEIATATCSSVSSVLVPQAVSADSSAALRRPESRTKLDRSSTPVTAVSSKDIGQMDNKENNPHPTVGISTAASKSSERLASSLAARAALLTATAMTAKRKATVALTENDQSDMQRHSTIRQPLRTLQAQPETQAQEQAQSSHLLNRIPERDNSEALKKLQKLESIDRSPEKQDPRSALEKRIGAMR